MIKLAGLIVCAFAALTTQAAAINSLTLTPSGVNTVFSIAGTYPPDIGTTAYSAPNTPYALSFTLPTTPSSLAFIDTANGIFGIDTTVTVNSVMFPNSQIAFFDASQGGGLDVCLSEDCTPNPPISNYRWVLLGDTLFTGTVSNPIFTSGAAVVDSTQSFIESPVPEPGTFTLGAVGILALILHRGCRAC